jgi:heat shock protein HslJ
MATTRMACRELLAKQASAYYQALRHTATFTVENQRLSLRDASGDELAVFAAESQMLAGTHWEVTAYNNGNQAVVSVLGGTHLSARFSDDGQVTGSAGCNQYFAYFQVDAGNITIGLPGATRRFCAEPKGTMDQELAYLTALSSAKTFRLEGDRLTLRTSDGALAVTLVGDTASTPSPTVTAKPKIRFDVERLNAQGLIGPPDGLRALDYEYCIPDQPEVIRQVQAIDPTLQIQKGSPGRVGCDQNQLLCLGNTHQADFRSVLERLAALPFVTAIHQAFFE